MSSADRFAGPADTAVNGSLPRVEIPNPAAVGAIVGVSVGAAIVLVNILPSSQGHGVLVAAIATPYLAFALLDGSSRSLVIEIAVMVAFVTAAFVAFTHQRLSHLLRHLDVVAAVALIAIDLAGLD